MKRFKLLLYYIHTGMITAVTLTAGLLLILYLSGIRFYTVETGSMYPAIPANSICFVSGVIAFDSIVPGDVIVFHRGDMTVTHRVVKITEKGFVTRGDANRTEDSSLVTAEEYSGKLLFSIPKIGIAVRLLRTLPGKLTVIALFLIMQILTFLLSRP